MNNRSLFSPRTLTESLTIISGFFRPNGAGAPLDFNGRGISIVRTAVGRYTFTLANQWQELTSACINIGVVNPSTESFIATIVSVDLSSRTILFNIQDFAGAETDIAADANRKIAFHFYLKNTGALRS